MVASSKKLASPRPDRMDGAEIELVGLVDRVVFHAEDSGYVVFSLGVNGRGVTCCGIAPDLKKGDRVELKGAWFNHQKFGAQFKFTGYSIPRPIGKAETIAYLETLPYVTEKMAAAIYDRWGEEVFKIFDDEPGRLQEISGIGVVVGAKIQQAYEETNRLRSLIAFLHSIGVSASYARKLDDELGSSAVEFVKRDPYMLIERVKGFGFVKADDVARKLGIGDNSPQRVDAGLIHALNELTQFSGHCFIYADEFQKKAIEVLTLPTYSPTIVEVRLSIERLLKPRQKDRARIAIDGNRIYKYAVYDAEVNLASRLQIAAGETTIDYAEFEQWIGEYQTVQKIQLADEQRSAVLIAAQNKMSILTGGAGVGKTATTKAVISWWRKQKKRIVACAPTGKAAQRIKELTGLQQCSTIHRLLGWGGSGFMYDRECPIDCDAILVDESSMMDVILAYRLFDAIPPHADILLVGDINQLPSVGPGNVLRDIISSKICPVTHLTKVFRQGAGSKITTCSHQINDGFFPDFEPYSDQPTSDALWIECDRDEIASHIDRLIQTLPYDRSSIQILSPQYKTAVGNIALNQMVQERWNPETNDNKAFGFFRVGDRVIQTKNDYNLSIFNGDIGDILSVDREAVNMSIDFSDSLENLTTYPGKELDNLQLAYSISVHKSQGSEFPVVILPVTMSHYMMLQRNLLYTAVTRAKQLLIVVGERDAIKQAIRIQGNSKRQTRLLDRVLG